MERPRSLALKTNNDLQNKLLQQAYSLAGVTSMKELSSAYDREDQNLYKAGEWDYDNPDLLTNKIKHILESINPNSLTPDEMHWQQEILWFWYHHAISVAIWKYKDKRAAQKYAAKALRDQPAGHPNQITKLLYLLVYDRQDEAKKWAKTISDDVERTSAVHLLSDYAAVNFD